MVTDGHSIKQMINLSPNWGMIFLILFPHTLFFQVIHFKNITRTNMKRRQLREELIGEWHQEILCHLLDLKFNPLSPYYLNQIGQADSSTLLKWIEATLGANRIIDVFKEKEPIDMEKVLKKRFKYDLKQNVFQAVLCRLLKLKFGQIPLYYINQINDAEVETILKWIGAVLEAEDVTEVFE
jgi:hypothetical protein